MIAGRKSIRIADFSDDLFAYDALLPFAREEWWCRHFTATDVPILHVWRHPSAFVIGLRDRRLPRIAYAKKWLEEQNLQVVVRHSGGAAVPLDTGVLNISWLMPKPIGHTNPDEQFLMLAGLIQQVVTACGHQANQGEIEGAYCPGQYDVSIAGRKFCGIAQRRLQHSLSIQAFINVEGIGEARARLAQQFYQYATDENQNYPQIQLARTTSLAETIHPSFSVAQWMTQFKQVLFEQQRYTIEEHSSVPMPSKQELLDLTHQIHQRYGLETSEV